VPLPDGLTPLVYLVFAAVTAAAAHRLVRPLSLKAAAVIVALPLVFTGPALLTARIFGPVDLAYMGQPLWAARDELGLRELHSPVGGDVTFQMIPWKKAVRYELKNGRWPLWNRFMLSGDILAAAAVPAPYHPIHLVSYLLPLGPSLGFIAAAVLFLAALSGFLYLREVRCREEAALVGAAAWMASGFVLFWLQWPHAMTVAVFPLVLLGVRRLVRAPGRRPILLLAAAFVLVLLGGHPESAFHVVAAGALYGALELMNAGARGATRGHLLRSVAAAVVAGALALALTAVYLLPFVEAMPQSREYALRRQVFPAADRSVAAAESLARLRVNALPFVYGLPWKEEAGRADRFFVPLSSAYVGSCLFPFMLYGLWRHRWRGRWWLLGLAAGGLAAGASAPVVADLLAALPLFDLSINKRLVFVAGFALAALAALGADAWADGRRERRSGARRSHEVAALTLGVLLGLGLLIAGQWQSMLAAGLSRGFLTGQSLRSLVPLALAAGIFAVVRRAALRGPALLALLLLLVTQRYAEAGPSHPVFSRDAFFPPLPELEELRRQEGVFRIVGVGTALLPNLSALYELEDVRGYQGMYFARSAWTHPLWCEAVGELFFHRVDDLRRPFLSFLNVRFAIVPRGFPLARTATAGWILRSEGRGASIYENPNVVERVFVPEEVWVNPPQDRMLRQMRRAEDFGRTAWLELQEGGTGAAAGNPRANGPGTVGFTRRPYGYLIDAEMEGDGWVVVSETAWKGWRARRGGEELPIVFANRGFIAFHLPVGSHRVELVYRPASFALGRAITFATGFLLLSAGIATWRTKRRTRR
jgi:hypothetical protein